MNVSRLGSGSGSGLGSGLGSGSGWGSGWGSGSTRKLAPLVVGWSVCWMVCAGGCVDEFWSADAQEFTVRVSNLTPSQSLYTGGRFDTPEGAIETGPLGPGQSYRVAVTVHPGAQVQLISMFLESNDAFLALAPGGMALWSRDGQPLAGDRSAELVLYDAGTERNEPLGRGESQAPRQEEPGSGVAEGGVVQVLAKAGDGPAEASRRGEFPAIPEFAELHVIHRGGPEFELVLRNVSSSSLIEEGGPPKQNQGKPAFLSPGVFTVHDPGVRWFEIGEPASPSLERLAEDGDPEPLAAEIAYKRGVSSHLSAVVWMVHDGDAELCSVGTAASPGLEDLVEDGRSEVLGEELERAPGVLRWGVAVPNRDGQPEGRRRASTHERSPVIEPGESASLRFRAEPGDRFTFVTGYLAANDKLVGLCGPGVALFEDGEPRRGELSWFTGLYDAGTELDEPPGLGDNQFERQSQPGAGVDEGGVVRAVRGAWMGWDYPPSERIVAVHLTVERG
jgi:hypothetical protein